MKSILTLILFISYFPIETHDSDHDLFAQKRKGKLILSSNPEKVNVTIYANINYIYSGYTPIELELPKDYYTIICRKSGYTDKKIIIYLENKINELITLELEPSFKPDQKIKIENPPPENSEVKSQKIDSNPITKKDFVDLKLGENLWDGPVNKFEFTRDEAQLYCSQKMRRLPTESELRQNWKDLQDYGWYWSSTEESGKFILVSLYSGNRVLVEKKDTKAYVRCIK